MRCTSRAQHLSGRFDSDGRRESKKEDKKGPLPADEARARAKMLVGVVPRLVRRQRRAAVRGLGNLLQRMLNPHDGKSGVTVSAEKLKESAKAERVCVQLGAS